MMNILKSVISILVILLFFNNELNAGEIHSAAKNGDLQKVKSLLKTNPELINAKDKKGFTPLHSAVSKGHKLIVTYLIEQGADINDKNKNGLTPLFQALDLSRNNVARVLIEKGANLNIKGYLNRTLLHMAARSGNSVVAGLLIKNGANVNARDSKGATPLDIAVSGGKTEVARVLLSNGGNINTFNTNNEETRILINRAIASGKDDVVKLVCEIGSNVKYIENKGYTLLHKAAAYGRTDIVNVLIESGLEVNSKGADGKTPIYLAEKYGHKNIVELLLKQGASKNSIGKESYGNVFLQKEVVEGEAYVCYLNHSSWAIKTKKHLLIFDYTSLGEEPALPSIANGFIVPEEIKGQNVTVFVSHGHSDHYDRKIFDWKKSVANINYVLGFKPRGIFTQKYLYVGPRQTQTINGVAITTIKSTDSGVGFLVKVDGLSIYHAGDHANKQKNDSNTYHREIDYLAQNQEKIDFAFLVSGSACGGGSPVCVLKGDFYAIKKLSPKVVFPMHSGGHESVYTKFEKDALKSGINNKIVCAQYRGDRFFYKDGEIK
jgi:ankyrin repeat protein